MIGKFFFVVLDFFANLYYNIVFFNHSSHQSDNSESGDTTPEPAVSSCSAANTAKGKLPPIKATAESSPKPNTEKLPNISKMTAKKQLSLEEENRQLKEARLCKVCMDNEVSLLGYVTFNVETYHYSRT